MRLGQTAQADIDGLITFSFAVPVGFEVTEVILLGIASGDTYGTLTVGGEIVWDDVFLMALNLPTFHRFPVWRTMTAPGRLILSLRGLTQGNTISFFFAVRKKVK